VRPLGYLPITGGFDSVECGRAMVISTLKPSTWRSWRLREFRSRSEVIFQFRFSAYVLQQSQQGPCASKTLRERIYELFMQRWLCVVVFPGNRRCQIQQVTIEQDDGGPWSSSRRSSYGQQVRFSNLSTLWLPHFESVP
jgi:hypothetical protein